MKKAKRKAHKASNKMKARQAKGKAKGKPPKALRRANKNEGKGQNQPARVAARAITRKNKRRPRAVAPPPREVGLIDAIGEVMATCEELAQEMHDWSDNMPESKQGSSKQDEVNTAAEALDQAVSDDPTLPEHAWLNDIKIMIQDPTPKRQPRSRSTRLGDATEILLTVIDKCEDVAADKQYTTEQIADASTLKDTLENIESDLQAVEFPGMFG